MPPPEGRGQAGGSGYGHTLLSPHRAAPQQEATGTALLPVTLGRASAGHGDHSLACHTGQASTGSGSLAEQSYQGFFSMRSSSFRKPFCSIHLSLRNLVLRNGGVTRAPQGPTGPPPMLRGSTACPAPLLDLTGAAETPRCWLEVPGGSLWAGLSAPHGQQACVSMHTAIAQAFKQTRPLMLAPRTLTHAQARMASWPSVWRDGVLALTGVGRSPEQGNLALGTRCESPHTGEPNRGHPPARPGPPKGS